MKQIDERKTVKKSGRTMRKSVVVLVLALSVSFALTYLVHSSARSSDEARFTAERNRIHYAIEGRIAVYIGLLDSTRAFVRVPGNLERGKFRSFISDIGIDSEYRGIQGIGYSQVVRPGGKDKLVKKMFEEGATDFRPYPEAGRQIALSIIYLEPSNERNRRAIGFDLTSEAHRKEALDRARDTGQVAITSRITLVQEITADKQAGFLIVLPVYEGVGEPDSIDSRRERIQGFVSAPFRAGDLFEELKKTVDAEDVSFSVFDAEESPTSLLYSDDDAADKSTAISPALESLENLSVAGSTWIIKYKTRDSFGTRSPTRWTPLVGASGLAFSLSLLFLFYRESRTRVAAELIAGDLAKTEDENRRLYEKETEARVQAEAASKVKDEFISMVSHELRTPLNAIAGWTRVLKSNELSQSTKEAALEKVDRNLRLQAALVEDLLTFSQIASGGFVLTRSSVELAALLDSVANELEPAIAEKKLAVYQHDETCGRRIYGDAEKLRLLLLKLLGNAIKFTPDHGRIDVTISASGDGVEFSVKDTGRGINSEFLPFIFERFRQSDSSITRRFGGLGLGLAICSRIVTMHGGTIIAKSEGENMGAEFVVTLPASEVGSLD